MVSPRVSAKSDTTGRADVLLRCEALHDLLGQHDARQAVLDSLHPLATGNAVLQATLAPMRDTTHLADLLERTVAALHAALANRTTAVLQLNPDQITLTCRTQRGASACSRTSAARRANTPPR